MKPNHDHIRDIEATDPTTLDLDTAEQYAQTLLLEVQRLEQTLGDRRRCYESNPYASAQEYGEWRRRANNARTKLVASYRRFKSYCREQRQQVVIDCGDFDPEDSSSLLRAARELLHRLRDDGVDLEDKELAVVVGLDRYLDKHPQT